MFTSTVSPKNGNYYEMDNSVKQYIEENYVLPGKVTIQVATDEATGALTVNVDYRDTAAKVEWLSDATVRAFLNARKAFYA